ncbi:MFS family permease [Mycolicibacterium sp. BK556]|uniref:MFS transporter n=1 Tax=Mycobacteriaceae TaxID=1762 RepID=UPI00105B3518|nr:MULTISPECIES: MFS transporter [Mycobacteriaceae]MBB3604602.1 MFS family permease [Mycolicibacterium sp. BK556]MBB3634685.1 MFS family permease [Mycolicibacterium sp. BK607]MBB3752261.1 MFS family permease [Mycolicibacterium sp. BK634]TDO17492.1 MFS transporter [Mycobacterium sp. BK086]
MARPLQGGQNYRVLLTQGTFFKVGVQVSSISAVIPYMADQLGSPAVVVALLAPAFTAGTMVGTMLGPKVLRMAVSVTGLLVGIALTQATLTALVALDIALAPRWLFAYPLLLACLLIGTVTGSSQVVSPMAMSALLSAQERGDLMLRQAGYSGALVVLITAFTAGHLLPDSPRWHDADLLWVSVVAMLVGAVCCATLRAPGVELARGPARMIDTLREGRTQLLNNRWLRQFMTTNLVFVPVILTPTFYAIYAAEFLAESVKVDQFLVFVGVGLLAGIPLWRLVRRQWGARGVYLCSALISVVAAALCIASQQWHVVPGLWAFGPAMLLSAVANQALLPAAYDWIFGHADGADAAVLISCTHIVISVAMIVSGFALGLIAEGAPAVWPLVTMLVLTAVAGASALRAPGVQRAPSQDTARSR